MSSDQGCFYGNLTNVDDYVTECASTMSYCGVEFFSDWLPTGFQQMNVRRGCRSKPAPDHCLIESPVEGFLFKDCWTTCTSDRCNNQNDVFSKAAEIDPESKRPREISCLSCSSDFDDNEDFCRKDGVEKSCPVFANSGCFKSRTHVTTDDLEEDHYFRGCSTFHLKEGMKENEEECSEGHGAGGEKLEMCDFICNGEKDEPCNTGEMKSDDSPDYPDNDVDDGVAEMSLASLIVLFLVL